MYIDVLKFGRDVDFFSKKEIEQILSNRVKGLSFSSRLSITACNNLLTELTEFKWIELYSRVNYKKEDFQHSLLNRELYSISFVGEQILEAYSNDYWTFYNALIKELNSMYTIPAWFIQRLWDLNSNQGQLIIPSPRISWNPEKRKWSDKDWNKEIEDIVSDTWNYITSILPEAFPYPKEHFVSDTAIRWEELGKTKPRRIPEKSTEFTPRKRLSQSMREASINFFFGNKNPRLNNNDFLGNKSPLLPRTYSYWCARLEELGLINYTDYNPQIPGRIIYPVSTFREDVIDKNLSEIKHVFNLHKHKLALFNPSTDNKEFRSLFILTLYEEYYKLYLIKKSLYVSVQDVRDEVCRLLKLNAHLFNTFLEKTIHLMDNGGEAGYRISLETDIREDQKSGSQILRRPVYVNKKIVTLIAITNI